MCALRLSLAGTITLALVGGLGSAITAQEDPMAPAVVTGTITRLGPDFKGRVSVSDDTITRVGYSATNRWEASDSRLSGMSTYTGNWREHVADEFQVEAAARVVENDGGRWVGTGIGLVGPSIDINTDTIVLHGEGGYEGLTAYVLSDWSTEPPTFWAAIFPGEMPPFPDPAAE